MLLGDVITLLIHISVLSIRGLVVTESGGTLFQQIFFEPERRSGNYCYHSRSVHTI